LGPWPVVLTPAEGADVRTISVEAVADAVRAALQSSNARA